MLSFLSGCLLAGGAGNIEREDQAAAALSLLTDGQLVSVLSLMSSSGVPVEEIARLAGHSSSRTTEVVYRRELRPVITTGAEIMDKIFAG